MKKNVDLLNGPIDSSLRNFSLPLVASFMLSMLYSWIDKWFVSRLGDVEIAAVGLSEQFILFIFTIGVGFAVGSGVVVSRRIGEANYEDASKVASLAIVIMFFFSTLLSIIFYFLMPYILTSMGYQNEIRTEALKYLNILLIGFPFNFLTFQINAMVRSAGNTVYPMTILIITVILNAIFAPIFIFGFGIIPQMGIWGAGLATALAQMIGCLMSLNYMMKGRTIIKFKPRDIRFDKEIIKTIIKKGIPSTFQYLSSSLNRIFLFTLANKFGTTVVTAYTLGLSVDLFVYMPVFGVGIAMEIITGQNIGAKKEERIELYFRSAMKQIFVLMLCFTFVSYFFGAYFAKIFTKDQLIIEHVSEYLKITSLTYFCFAVGIITTRIISGAGDTLRSFAITSGILFLFQIAITYSLSFYFELGARGIWIGIALSILLFALVSFFNYRGKKWLSIKL